MEQDKQIVCIYIVAKRKLKEDIIDALQNSNINLTNIVYGKGAIKAGFLQNMLGLVPEENKVVLISMTTYSKAEKVLKLLIDDFEFNKPNTGIAFTIPIDAVSY